MGSINQVYKTLDPFTLNLSLSFLTLGINRCDNNTNNENIIELIQLLKGFLVLLGEYCNNISSVAKKTQCFQISHLVLYCIELLVTSTTTTTATSTNKKTLYNNKEDNQNQQEKKEKEMNNIRILLSNENNNISKSLFHLLLDG